MMNRIRQEWRTFCGLAAIRAMERLDYRTATKWLRRAGWLAAPNTEG